MDMPFNQPITTYDGWGVNPAYMTPSYMANFRPSYSGDDGRNPYANNRGLMSDAWTGIGPGAIPFGADPFAEAGAAKANIANSPFDAAMTGLQSVAIPLAAWYGAEKLLGTTGIARRAGRFGGAVGAGALNATGRGAVNVLGRVPYVGGLFRGMGAVAGATRLGAGLSGAATAVGGLAGGFMLPILAGQAVASGIDSAIMDPFVSTRRGTDAMRSNMARQYVGGAGTATHGGFGMSAVRAHEISAALTKAGAESFAFQTEDFNRLADMGMSAGLFNEIGNMDADRVVSGVKDMMKAIQTLSAISGGMSDPEMIQVLSKLKAGGIDDFRRMEQVVKQLGVASATSGVSINQIIDTVGNQGMMMAQQQGMRGVTGLLASADAYAGFTNARKAGLITGAQMGALGGVEGMTQNVMTGAMSAMNSPLGMMTLMSGNRFGNGMLNSLQGFGQVMTSGNPMATMGDWALNRGTYMDQALRDQGTSGILIKTLQDRAREMRMDASDPRVLAQIASTMGVSSEEVRSALIQNQAYKDPTSRLRASNARDTKVRQEIAAKMHQEGLTLLGIPIAGDIQQAYKEWTTDTVSAGANVGNAVSGISARFSDWWDRTTASSMGLKLDDQRTARVQGPGGLREYALEGREFGLGITKISEGMPSIRNQMWKSNQWSKEIGSIMQMANNGSPEQKAKANELLQLLSVEGDGRNAASGARVRQLIAEMEDISGGNIFGTSNAIDRDDAVSQFMERGYYGLQLKSYSKEVLSDRDQISRALDRYSMATGDIPMRASGLSDEERLGLFGGIFGATGDKRRLEEFFANSDFGGKKSEVAKLLGLSPDASDIDIQRAAHKMSTKDIGDIKSEEELRQELLIRSGGDVDLVEDILKTQTVEGILDRVNDKLYLPNRNTGALLNEIVSEGRRSHESARQQKSREANAADINMEYVKDIGKNIEMGFESVNWSQNMDSNTRALARLTDALLGTSQGSTLKSIQEKLNR